MAKFTCKKVEDKRTDVSTNAVNRPDDGELEKMEQEEAINKMNQVRIDIIRRHYGSSNVPKEIFSVFKVWDVISMGASIVMTKPNTVQAKKNTLLLFINNRLVENDKIKRTIDNSYSQYQPKGGYSYLMYMALSVDPKLIDVNVHPTKKQVFIER